MDTIDPQRGNSRRRLTEHRRAATRAGLRYVSDGASGITRKRVGTGWAYYLPNGARITDTPSAEEGSTRSPSRRRGPTSGSAPIPTATSRPRRATRAGRKQYRYHPAYREARDHSKFRHMLEFSEVLPLLRERIERDLRAPDHTRRQLLATVVAPARQDPDPRRQRRVRAREQVLRPDHAAPAPRAGRRQDAAASRFRGKSGVEHSVSLSDPRLARIIQRCQDLPGHELFQYLDAKRKRQSVSSDDVNAYLREITGRDITAKDFRTWGGTMLAAVALRAMGPAVSRREADRNILRAIDAVAERLGNTRAVCRKYYVHPTLLRAYLMGLTVPLADAAGAREGRRRQPGRRAAPRRDRGAAVPAGEGRRLKDCELCRPAEVLFESDFAYVSHESNPLSPGHVIVVPRRHVPDYFDMSGAEQGSVLALLNRAKKWVQEKHRPDGYNIGVNVGKAAGQSRMHVHVHLIPRYAGDVSDPRGGIRCVLSGKQ